MISAMTKKKNNANQVNNRIIINFNMLTYGCVIDVVPKNGRVPLLLPMPGGDAVKRVNPKVSFLFFKIKFKFKFI